MQYQFLYVALGGALGATLRYWISSFMHSHSSTVVPVGTLTVNLLGSLAIGWLWGIFSMHSNVPLRLQLFLITGLLGGFTTFSSFSLEGWQILEQGHYRAFIIYLLASNVGGILLAVIGFRLAGEWFNI